ncbi:MAG: peptide chain release factor aRF-1 [Candidatus Aenigmatarchaeota archaeon]
MESKYKLKKILKELGGIKGRHTELVTVYIPSGYSLSEIANQLRSEQGTAANIKSKQVRNNVTTALEKIVRHLQLYPRTPENGLAIFCGNVSEEEGKADIKLWAIEPPEPIKVKLYWCDQIFRLEPLEEFVKEKEIYGMVCLDKSEADIAILKGKKIEGIAHMESIVPGKTRAGGQSSARFSRVREGLKHDWFKRVGDAVNKSFGEEKGIIGILLSGPGPIKEEFLKGDYLQTSIKGKIIGVIDTGYTGEYGLEETLERSKDIIREASVTREKNLVNEFFTKLQTSELVVYGRDETLKALRMGAVKTLLLSESLEDEEIEKECKQFNTTLEVISEDTREGQQFRQLGGIGGILRFQIS